MREGLQGCERFWAVKNTGRGARNDRNPRQFLAPRKHAGVHPIARPGIAASTARTAHWHAHTHAAAKRSAKRVQSVQTAAHHAERRAGHRHEAFIRVALETRIAAESESEMDGDRATHGIEMNKRDRPEFRPPRQVAAAITPIPQRICAASFRDTRIPSHRSTHKDTYANKDK
jgi:hypothetical protein